MTPEQAIARLDEMFARCNAICNPMLDEAHDITVQWDQLGQAGGKRADHAAALLSRLRPHLRDLASFAQKCEQQIAAMQADPFREGG